MSASPAPSDAAAASSDQPKRILFRFCQECSNLLYPKEDKDNSALLFSCRTCSYSEPAPSACIMRHEIASTVGDTAGITQDVGQDPTVGYSASFPDFCTYCGEAILCSICGQETEYGFNLEVQEQPSPPVHVDSEETRQDEPSPSPSPFVMGAFHDTLPPTPDPAPGSHQEEGRYTAT